VGELRPLSQSLECWIEKGHCGTIWSLWGLKLCTLKCSGWQINYAGYKQGYKNHQELLQRAYGSREDCRYLAQLKINP
jgi:hypothetical protein